MARGRAPLFLHRESYRHSRFRDAARLLPVFGAFLTIVPMLLLPLGEPGATSSALIYLFGFWIVLIILAALIADRIGSPEGRRSQPPEQNDSAGGPG